MFLPSNGLKYGLKWSQISNLDHCTSEPVSDVFQLYFSGIVG